MGKYSACNKRKKWFTTRENACLLEWEEKCLFENSLMSMKVFSTCMPSASQAHNVHKDKRSHVKLTGTGGKNP